MSRAVVEKWLFELTNLPTASGLEHRVSDWVLAWARRRQDLETITDTGGNVLIRQRGRVSRAPVLAVAHMDHPAFVISEVAGGDAAFEFRGGVRADYFARAAVRFVTGEGKTGRVVVYDADTRRGLIRFTGPRPQPDDIAIWRLPKPSPGSGRFMAPACDDLAGCAAALAFLDRARKLPNARHWGVLLTRAEEVGFVGALHAAKSGSIPRAARILSIEASRASAEAPLGGGPVVRIGDAATVFDNELTNLISAAAARKGIGHQRRLMAGGSCEATAFGAYGYRAAGLCLPLRNYHNMGNLDSVEEGSGKARVTHEEIALSDFHGLVDLLVIAAEAVDGTSDLRQRMDTLYSKSRHLLT